MIAFIEIKELINLILQESGPHITLKEIIDIIANNIGKRSSEAFNKGNVSWYNQMENPYHVGTQEYFDFHLGKQTILGKIAEDE